MTCTRPYCIWSAINHERLTYRFQGRDYRLTDVHGDLIQPILA